VNVGALDKATALRFGILRIGASDNPTAIIFVGEQEVHSYRVTAGPPWFDTRVDLSAYANDDESCYIELSDAQGIALAPCTLIREEEKSPPNILIFMIDTLRKDHLGSYGYTRDTSPNIDKLAREGVVFENHMPQSTWTRPSVASLLTSLYPSYHGPEDWPDVMREGLSSLGASLGVAGYTTHGLFSNPNVTPTCGKGDEFERVVYFDELAGQDDAEVVDAAITTIKNEVGWPWFLYVHTMARMTRTRRHLPSTHDSQQRWGAPPRRKPNDEKRLHSMTEKSRTLMNNLDDLCLR
jgi:hypothetical protein